MPTLYGPGFVLNPAFARPSYNSLLMAQSVTMSHLAKRCSCLLRPFPLLNSPSDKTGSRSLVHIHGLGREPFPEIRCIKSYSHVDKNGITHDRASNLLPFEKQHRSRIANTCHCETCDVTLNETCPAYIVTRTPWFKKSCDMT